MRIVLFGLGHVGATVAACLAEAGHRVHGIDVDPGAVAALAAGRVREPGLGDLLARNLAAGRLSIATGAGAALDAADLVLVCVATPAAAAGGLELADVLAVTRALGAALRRRPADRAPLLIVYRSTLPPGTTTGTLLPLLERVAGEGPGRRYEVACNPEFLRQGSAVADFLAPARIVLGERRPGATRRLGGLYDGLQVPVLEVPFAVAELAKLADNGWHALKVAFANEVGRIAVAAGVEPEAVMTVLRADPSRNLGPAYLRPGAPFGGSCLPKDLAALLAHGAGAGLALPALAGAAASNVQHRDWLLARIRARVVPPGPLLQVGLSFKAGTEDLRGSPLLELAQALVAAGYELALHDPDLPPERLRAICRELKATACPSGDAARAAAAAARLVVLGKPWADPAVDAPVMALPGLAGV